MARQPIACVALATLLASASLGTLRTQGTLGTISAESFLAHIRYLSSDSLGGRGNGTEGLERAGAYIAELFTSGGLEPGGSEGTYVQAFEADMRVEPPAGSPLVLHLAGRDEVWTIGDQFYPLGIIDRTGGRPEPSASRVPLVFAGYGISAPGLGYDDFAGVDVRGAAVLVFTHEPQEHDAASPFNGKALTPGAAISSKVREAERRGAVMLLVADDPSHNVDYAVSKAWWNDPQTEEFAIPVLRVARARLERSLPGFNFERTGREIDITGQPHSGPVAGVTVSYTEHRARLRPTLRNIVGVVRGSDPALAGEAVVVGSHYDHLGGGGRFSEAPEATGTPHNGADDNASGTAAMIEVCRAVARLRPRLPRTVVCAAFAGEELGVLGSRRFTTDPPVPGLRTVAMVNLDMVGRARGRVMVGAFGPFEGIDGLRREMRGWTRLAVDDFSRGAYQAGDSDTAPFVREGVPVIAFFTGFHSDYHRPTDDWQKIDAAGGAQVADLALRVVTRLARQGARKPRPAGAS
jgi:hypothetical protein